MGVSDAGPATSSSRVESSFFAERKQPPLLLDAQPLTIDADHAENVQPGALDGMGTRNVVVAEGDCGFHGETVAEAPVWGQ